MSFQGQHILASAAFQSHVTIQQTPSSSNIHQHYFTTSSPSLFATQKHRQTIAFRGCDNSSPSRLLMNLNTSSYGSKNSRFGTPNPIRKGAYLSATTRQYASNGSSADEEGGRINKNGDGANKNGKNDENNTNNGIRQEEEFPYTPYSDDEDIELFNDDELLEMLSNLDKHDDEHPNYGLEELEELEELLREELGEDVDDIIWNSHDDDDHDDEEDIDIGDLAEIEDDDDDDVQLLEDEILNTISNDIDIIDSDDIFDDTSIKESTTTAPAAPPIATTEIVMETTKQSSTNPLEQALLQGVVPVMAGVGSSGLPGDYGFDPLGLATKDYFKQSQNFLLRFLPSSTTNDDDMDEDKSRQDEMIDSGAALPRTIYSDSQRPAALILRDYREAEIRHGRLAMLAAILWPLQEIIDRLFIPESFGQTTMIYGGVTLPYLSLLMTFIMLLLGYLDIYAASVKDADTGEAFLPGECFWDPLSMLVGASDQAKRNMQRRELNNGRWAMLAVFFYILQEGLLHQPLITLPWNQILFEPAFEIPEVQAWLDAQFASGGELVPLDPEFTDSLKEVMEEFADDVSD